MDNEILMDFAILLLISDKIGTKYISHVIQKYPYSRIMDAVNNWPEVEKTFIENGESL
jgi:hypothetical protein